MAGLTSGLTGDPTLRWAKPLKHREEHTVLVAGRGGDRDCRGGHHR